MARLAKVMYIILPSKLNEYPSGKINDTILSLQPKRSSSSVNLGNTASLLVVLKATSKGCEMRLSSSGTRLRSIIYPTDNNKAHRQAMPKINHIRYKP